MARSIGTNLAVPRATLAAGGDALAFEPLGWAHLAAYLDKVEKLPRDAASLSPQAASAFEAIGKAVRAFGSPTRLAAMMAEHPALLTGEAPPVLPYSALVWSVARLHAAVDSVLTLVHRLADPAGTPAGRRDALRSLGTVAAGARDLSGPLLPAISSFRTAIVASHKQLEAASAAANQVLQQEWEAVGACRARIESLKDKISRTGLLGAHKRQELAAQLNAAEQQLASLGSKAERLRIQVAALQEVLTEGAWLDASLGGMIDFLQNARAAWATFGSAMTQLAADAGENQLEPGPLRQQLDLDEAIPQWQALAGAAARFAARAAPPEKHTPARSYG